VLCAASDICQQESGREGDWQREISGVGFVRMCEAGCCIYHFQTRLRSCYDAAVLSSLGFAGTVCQLSQLTKCRRLRNGLKTSCIVAWLHSHGRLLCGGLAGGV
jgi:hypothetical protein